MQLHTYWGLWQRQMVVKKWSIIMLLGGDSSLSNCSYHVVTPFVVDSEPQENTKKLWVEYSINQIGPRNKTIPTEYHCSEAFWLICNAVIDRAMLQGML